jgi:quercetin dioxygenase-like cupin family protein
MIRCVRIWTGEDGNSTFEEGSIDLSKSHGKDVLSAVAPAVSVSFRETPSGGDYGWHNDPTPQLVITLSGTLQFTVNDGRTFTIRPGDVLFAEDHTGTGHTWRLLDEQPWRRAYVVTHQLDAVPFVAQKKLAAK